MSAEQTEFARLLTAAQPVLYAYIHTLTFNYDSSIEVLQQTNLTIWEHRQQFTPNTNFNAWAVKIAYFQVLTWRKKNKRNRLVPGDHLFELLVSKQSPDGLPTELGHKQDDLESSRLDALKACFEKLSTHHQECLNHRYKEGMSLKTIAQKLNKSENSISQLLVRIKAFLAECISKNINKTN